MTISCAALVYVRMNLKRTKGKFQTLSVPYQVSISLSLQTYGIVQQDGNVDYMTFVLSVEEDGPAYMAGLRPG